MEQRILQICHGYDGPFLDCARQYAALFQGTRYQVTTVYLTGSPNAEVERASCSDEVIFLDTPRAGLRGLKLGALRALKRHIKGRDYRFCIAHRAKPTYLALLSTDLKVISVNHALGNYRRWQRRVFAHLFKNRLSIIGVSDAVRDDIRASLTNWDPSKIETLYNRLDVDYLRSRLLSRKDARNALGLPQAAWIVGNVGRLHPDKDQSTLIKGFAKALARLPAGSLLAIAGSGRLEGVLKTLALSLGIEGQVIFLGQVAEARRYFKAFDVFVLSSGPEACPMVVLEAMAANLPVIATDCGGAPELVAEVGKLFLPRDEEGLANALITQLEEKPDIGLLHCENMTLRVNALFSDQAARMRFWSTLLPQFIGFTEKPQ